MLQRHCQVDVHSQLLHPSDIMFPLAASDYRPIFFVGRGWGRCDRTSVCRCVLTGNVSNNPDSRADVNVHCNLLQVGWIPGRHLRDVLVFGMFSMWIWVNSPDVADLSRRKLSSYLSVVRRMCRVNILANVAIFEISDVNSSQAEVLANPLALVDVTQCNM